MSIFRNKILIKIVASLCVVLTIINMGIPNTAHADDLSEYGGILIVPVTNLLVSVCDGIVGLLHETIQYQDITLIQISGEPNWWTNFWKPATAIIITTIGLLIGVAIVGAAFVAATGALAYIKIGTLTAVTILGAQYVTVELFDIDGGLLGAGAFIAEKLGNYFFGTLYMPVYTITPRYIFSNQIRLFDINFFDPMESETVETETKTREEYYDIIEVYYDTQENIEKDDIWTDGISIATENILINASENECLSSENEWKNSLLMEQLRMLDGTQRYSIDEITEKINPEYATELTKIIDDVDAVLEEKGDTAIDRSKGKFQVSWAIDDWGNDGNLYNTAKLTIDYKPNENNEVQQIVILISMVLKSKTVTETQTLYSSAEKLKGIVSEWYFTLRNLALLMLMLILIYVGIRIVIGSTAGQKAKYKERLKDWLVAVCLLFIMHYIMVFAVELVGMITNLLSSTKMESGLIVDIPLKNEHKQSLNELQELEDSQEFLAFQKFGNVYEDSDGTRLAWTTDIMGKFRIMAQTTEEGTVKWVGYAMCYMVLVIYTVFFTWTYLKRVLYMAFLTLIAPLVAMTYPLDKINDGKAQAFSMWLKEYIFNLLIQPMHLLLYTILVTSAYKLASTNALYALVAIGFMVPSEQLIRKFFGFTKAQTAGTLGGAAGAALAYTGLQNVMKFTKKLTGKEEKDKDKKGKDIKLHGEDFKEGEVVADSLTGKHTNRSEGKTNQNSNANIRGANREEQNEDEAGNQQDSDVKMNEQTDRDSETEQDEQEQQKDGETSNDSEKPPEEAEQKEEPSEESKKEEKIKGSIIRGVVGSTGKYMRLLGNKMGKRVKKQRPIRALARGVAGIYGGAIMGMAGAALGVASGDPSKAMQYTTAAAVGGYGVGKAVAGKSVDALHVNSDKLWDAVETSFYGDRYKEVKLKEALAQMAHDQDNIMQFRKYFPQLSEGEVGKILGGEIGEKCLIAGLTDMEDIAAVYKAINEEGFSAEQAIAGLKYNNYLPDKLKNLGKDEQEDMINMWAKQFEDMKEEDPEKYKDLDTKEAAARALSWASTMGKLRGGLTDA